MHRASPPRKFSSQQTSHSVIVPTPMPRNEAQTRFELIDPVLTEERGWARADIKIEETAAAVDIVYKKVAAGQPAPLNP